MALNLVLDARKIQLNLPRDRQPSELGWIRKRNGKMSLFDQRSN